MKHPVLPVSLILILIMFVFSQSASVGSAISTTSVSLSSSANPVVSGQSVTLTASVSASNGTVPDGEVVAFIIDNNTIGTNTTTAGVATISTAFSPAGSYQVMASYAGDANNSAGNSTVLVETVNPVNLVPTAVSLSSSANPVVSYRFVTLTATVSASNGTVPDGDLVTFFVNNSPRFTNTTTAGVATMSTAFSPAGSFQIIAWYQGDASNSPSNSTALVETVNLIPTAVSLTSSANPSFAGEPVKFTATVSATNDSYIPDGDIVTFLDGGSVIGTSATSYGSATFTTPSLSVGSHNVTAAFSSDGTLAASTSTPAISQVVNALSTPAVPAGVTANAISSGTIAVSWAPSYSAASYGIYRSTSAAGPFTLIGSTAGSSFDSTGLTPDTTYYFEVTAANTAGTSGLSSPVSSTTLLGGKATSCTWLWPCNFNLTDGNAAGFVKFIGASVSFELPGETTTTNTGYVGSITYTPHGSYYHVIGKFVATDASTGQVVKFATDVWIIATGHAGRGGGITYSLHNGTITYTLTGQDPTTTTVACNPSSFAAGHSTTCTVTVTDNTHSANLPTGTISFGTSYGAYGTFSNGGTCTLSSGSCSVVFQTGQEFGGTIPIYATYAGDGTHYQSSGSTSLYVTVSD